MKEGVTRIAMRAANVTLPGRVIEGKTMQPLRAAIMEQEGETILAGAATTDREEVTILVEATPARVGLKTVVLGDITGREGTLAQVLFSMSKR